MKRLLIALGAMLLVLSAAPQAHPTANAFVIIRVPGDGRIDVGVTANAESLALTLSGLTGVAPANAIKTELPRLIELKSDGSPITLTWVGAEDARDRQGLVTVHLEGRLPAHAQTIRWRAPFMLAAYPLAVIGGSSTAAPDNYDWIAGTAPSLVYRLDSLGSHESAWHSVLRLVPTGFTHIVPGGLDHVLFMLGLFSWRLRDARCCCRSAPLPRRIR